MNVKKYYRKFDVKMLAIFFIILFTVIAYWLGDAKGYSGPLCAVAGLFGNLFAVIIIALLPDKSAANEEAIDIATRYNQEISDLKKQIAELKAEKYNSEVALETIKETESFYETKDVSDEQIKFATFLERTEESIECPRCGRTQKGTRDSCYSCGLKFIYQNELD